MIEEILIENYSYNLPEDRIAKYPLPNRDDSKILIFEGTSINESKFSNLVELLPSPSLMIFNNTKVVPARMFFKKASGASIQIFCIEPYNPSEYNTSFAATKECIWISVVGNAKRWREGEILLDNHQNDPKIEKVNLRASIIGKESEKFIVKFTWEQNLSFSEILELCGKIPIPPYLKRESTELDSERYQTVYAIKKGSVAAPTAGLHFTTNTLQKIDKKGITRGEVCLHVGAGTFIPVKSTNIADHKMHSEPFSINRELIGKIIAHKKENKSVIAVGTTSARTLESLYYLGVNCIEGKAPESITQWQPYTNYNNSITLNESLECLYNWMLSNEKETIECKTEMIIVPGFNFKVIDALITNFHQPQSTLLLLIAAFIGDNWRDVYEYALNNNFRFLSYGDSSILFKKSS